MRKVVADESSYSGWLDADMERSGISIVYAVWMELFLKEIVVAFRITRSIPWFDKNRSRQIKS